jgi:hypothetical protein
MFGHNCRTVVRAGIRRSVPARRALSTAARSPSTTKVGGAVAAITTLTASVVLCRSSEGDSGKKKKWKEEVLPEVRKAELKGRVDSWLLQATVGSWQSTPGYKASPLHFEVSLTAGERKFVHTLCEARRGEMSSKSEGKGEARHVVVYHTPIEEGMVNGVSAVRRLELAARVSGFKSAKDQSQGLHFEPLLTTAEREFVHEVAAEHGLSSKSEGKEYHGVDWHIVVRS